MGYWNQRRPYRQDKPIIGSEHGVETPPRATSTIAQQYVSRDEYGDWVVPAGLFTARVGGVDRFLPRAVATAAVATTSPTVAVTPHQVFVAGDTIEIIQNYAVVGFDGTWVANETLTVTIDGIPGTHTVVDIALADLADQAAVSLNGSPAGRVAEFVSNGAGNIFVFAKQPYASLSIAVAETSTAGTALVGGGATNLAGVGTEIGTVSVVDFANKSLTLEANAAVDVPPGVRVGIASGLEHVYGLYNHSIDFERESYKALKGIVGASMIYKDNLPYWDSDLAERFPKLTVL